MTAYMRFLLNGGRGPNGALISPQSFALLSSPGVTNGRVLGDSQPGMYHRYGYGLAIMNVGGDKVLAHTGGVVSYTACMMVDVTRGFAAIALSNLGYVGSRPCAIVSYAIETLARQADGKALPAPAPPHDPTHVTGAADYAGSYAAPNGGGFTIVANGDKLALARGSSSLPLYPRGDDTFWVDDPQFTTFGLQFERDASGKITSANSGPQWFTNQRYTGPRAFAYPPNWASYAGQYETMDPDGYYWSVHVYQREGKLWADGMQLVPLPGGVFHIGTDLWQPAWLRFAEPLAGRTQTVRMPGETLYRTNPY
jgi:hypothetical protein